MSIFVAKKQIMAEWNLTTPNLETIAEWADPFLDGPIKTSTDSDSSTFPQKTPTWDMHNEARLTTLSNSTGSLMRSRNKDGACNQSFPSADQGNELSLAFW